ncbi:MAG: AAA family ATPase [Planctomycetes bacterium]|nr:AAA family ATPase [Planctomycetota bacterium]
MKILAIRGQNLASLARTFEVDLEHGPLAGVGLFAITGPVGAGKSTLLDALCLPLFDQTPRLHGRGGPLVGDATQDPGDWLRANDPRTLLRRDASEGFAEVDFTGRDGVCYRARWSVRRARRRIDGRVQEQELSLHDRDRGTVVAAGRRSDVLLAVRQRLGLDFAQFCRSVLLAQGDFAAFLRAPADERARLLETLTGAEIYRRLSKAAHERARVALLEVEKLQQQIDAQQVLPDEQRQGLERDLLRLGEELRMAELGTALALEHVRWHEIAAGHRQRESEAVVALRTASETDQAALPRKAWLQAVSRALAVVPRWQLAREADEQAVRADEAEQRAATALSARRSAMDRAEQRWSQAFERTFAVPPVGEPPPVLAEFVRWRPLLAQSQQLDHECSELHQRLPRLRHAASAAEAAVDRAGEQLRAATVALQPLQQQLAAAEAAASVWANVPMAERRAFVEAQRATQARIEQRAADWQRAAQRHDQAMGRSQEIDGVLARATTEHAAAATSFAAAEAAVQRGREQVDGHRQKQALAAFSAQLAPGVPCPLCGSAEHSAPLHHDDGELAVAVRALAAAERVLQKAQAQLASAASDLAAAQRDRQRCDEERAAAAAELAAARQAFARAGGAATDLAAARIQVETSARAFAEELAACQRDEAAATAALQQLQKCMHAVRDAERVGNERRQQLAEATAAYERARHEAQQTEAAIAAAAVRAREITAALEPACESLPGGAVALARLPGERGDGRTQSGDRVAVLQALADELVTRRAAAAALQGAEAAHQQAAAVAGAARSQRQRAHADLLRAMEVDELQLASVEAAARLGADGIERAARELRALEDAVTQARSALQVIAQERQRHEAHARPAMDVEEAKQAVQQARASAAAIEARVDELRGRLFADTMVRRQRAELAPRLEAARATQGVWLQLDELIGSSTGDSFAVFAQGLTLDLLLVEANRRLAELARRYRLQRNRGGELDFVVVDLDLGGSTRSLMSLSGGETFLVSLALALALATLAAPRSRVETLFLDEGFGTLDAASLEQALGALDALQAAGCQVGIISHVDGIAERIGAQVVVQPEGAGQSRVVARVR